MPTRMKREPTWDEVLRMRWRAGRLAGLTAESLAEFRARWGENEDVARMYRIWKQHGFRGRMAPCFTAQGWVLRQDQVRAATMKTRKGKSSFRGVHELRPGRWLARLHHEGKAFYLGLFGTAELAAKAYDAASLDHRGFAVNFPEGA